MPKDSIHQLTFSTLKDHQEVHLSEYKGKKILFVNVASKCGFTNQYGDLQKLYERYKDNLVVIGFPCNQFLFQERGSDEKIAGFCSANYGVTFPMSTKIKVKGKKIHPIYEWLTRKSFNGVSDYPVTWNFNKFLVNEQGELLQHYGSDIEPLDSEITQMILTE